MAVVSTKLWENGKPIEAKGIQLRNDLEMKHFEDTNKGQWIIGTKYEAELDYVPEQDFFDAAPFNFEEKLSIPDDHEVEILETEEELKDLKVMLNQKIAIQIYQRPRIVAASDYPPSVLVISCKTQTFIIDLVKLHSNSKLNDALRIILDSAIVFGFGFYKQV